MSKQYFWMLIGFFSVSPVYAQWSCEDGPINGQKRYEQKIEDPGNYRKSFQCNNLRIVISDELLLAVLRELSIENENTNLSQLLALFLETLPIRNQIDRSNLESLINQYRDQCAHQLNNPSDVMFTRP